MIIEINNYSTELIIETIKESILNKDKKRIYYLNHYVIDKLAGKNILEKKDSSIKIIDGILMYLLLKIKNPKTKIYRLISTDVWSEIIKYSIKTDFSIVFWGGHKNNYTEEKIKSNFIGINLLELIDGYNYNMEEVINIINFKKPDILFVGLGSPLQEELIEKIICITNCTVYISVGSAIDYFAGYHKRAPFWMQRKGLEWLHRLIQEPGRLWRRYLIGTIVFVFKIIFLKVRLTLKRD